MLGTFHNNQIFDSIVVTDTINMMNDFIGSNRSADMLRHDINVFSHIAPFDGVWMIRLSDKNVALIYRSSAFPVTIILAPAIMIPDIMFGALDTKILTIYNSPASACTIFEIRGFSPGSSNAIVRAIYTIFFFTLKCFITQFTYKYMWHSKLLNYCRNITVRAR